MCIYIYNYSAWPRSVTKWKEKKNRHVYSIREINLRITPEDRASMCKINVLSQPTITICAARGQHFIRLLKMHIRMNARAHRTKIKSLSITRLSTEWNEGNKKKKQIFLVNQYAHMLVYHSAYACAPIWTWWWVHRFYVDCVGRARSRS